ncbi:unnamed protein product, partial [Discosporangium mesarthrocarpum]
LAGLWDPYRPKLFYNEVLDLVRRIMLTGVAVFIFPNSAAQVTIILTVAMGFLWITEVLRPYVGQHDKCLSRSGHFVVVATMFLGLLLKVDISTEGQSSQHIFSGFRTAVNVAMILVVLMEALFMCG